MIIETQRLELIPLDLRCLQAGLRQDFATMESLLGASLPAGWPREEDRYVFQLRAEQLGAQPDLLPWLLRAVVLRDSRPVIGVIGFHTAPGPGHLLEIAPDAVEFGLEILPPYQRQGYAREAIEGLIRWAHYQHEVRTFVMTIAPQNGPSQALAKSLGFSQVGSQTDALDGEEDILVLRLPAPKGSSAI